MTARTSTYDPAHVWSEGTWNGTDMLCQERPFFLGSQNLWSDPFYPHSSESSTCFLLICLVVIVVTITSVFLKPLGLPTMSKMFGGFFVIGMLFSKSERISSLLHPTVYYIFKTFSMLGFVFYSFIFGVETNMGALRKIGKKAVTISVVGFISSLALGYLSYNMLGLQDPSGGLPRYIIANALTYFMVTCSHVNELGIGNSDIARLAGAISLVVDIFGMFATNLIFNVFLPVSEGDYLYPLWILGVYFIMFFICRPLILLIVSYTPEGKRMKDTHFIAIILIILVLGLITIQADQHLAVLLMSLFLPEEPLTTILEGEVEHTSQSIRDVNKMVLEKAPCSAGLLIDKGDKDVTMFGNMMYRVGVFFIGGVDDHEALAYATLFATHPRIQITVIWLKSRMTESNTHRFDDYAVIQEFYNRLQANERIFLQEVLVSDGAETTNAIMQVKKDFDLVVVGRYHEPGCTPLFGLSDRWCEYPELGILGDMIVTPEFEFSVLVVQEEPHQATGFDELIDDFIM
ncbi:unnamed protein product [Amaranthus hypochondriacus]